MLFQRCPHCQNSTLAPTGAFWFCTDCRTAITSQALAAMKATFNTGRKQKALFVHRPL